MMVPRSYRHQSPPRRPSTDGRLSEKAPGLRMLKAKVLTPKKADDIKPILADRSVSEPVSVPSKPMVIPSRSQPSRPKSTLQTQTLGSRGHHGGRNRRPEDVHKPGALPPAVAALLAITAIPPPKPKATTRRSNGRASIDQLIQAWSQDDSCASSVTSVSPLDILLERADDVEGDNGSLFDETDGERDGMTTRSVSSESIPSMPSLVNDARSISSISSSASLSLTRRSGSERKEKIVISPPTEECFDHPLLSPAIVDEDPWYGFEPVSPTVRTATPKPASTFKSNLTASLQALKSAARSFSNFTAPSIPPEDLITRSLLSSQRFPSEMRPKIVPGVPTAALRRYLNPTVTHPYVLGPSPATIPEVLLPADIETPGDDKPMIQMEEYDHEKKAFVSSKKNQRRQSVLLEPAPTLIRQREPRENSDFLRVIVLEMNMRRGGKLDSKAAGRARIWLPPRKTGGKEAPRGSAGEVPKRWIGVHVDDE